MTEREQINHFAGLAMQAYISSQHLAHNWDNEDLEGIAKFSYAMACAMIDQRDNLIEGDVI